MADFARWGDTAARAMGYSQYEFITAYYENISRQTIESIESHPIGQVVIRFIEKLEEGGRA